jgi:hypothetical protein
MIRALAAVLRLENSLNLLCFRKFIHFLGCDESLCFRFAHPDPVVYPLSDRGGHSNAALSEFIVF